MNKIAFLAYFTLALASANGTMINSTHRLDTNISSSTNTIMHSVVPYYDIEEKLQEDTVMYEWITVFTDTFDQGINNYLNQHRVMFDKMNLFFGYEPFSSCELDITLIGTLNNHSLEHTFQDNLPNCEVKKQQNYTVYLNASMAIEHHNYTQYVCNFTRDTLQCSESYLIHCVLDMNYDINMSESTLFDEHGHLEIPLPKCPPSESPQNLELVLEVNMSMMPTK